MAEFIYNTPMVSSIFGEWIPSIEHWFLGHRTLLGWLGVLSAVMFLGTLVGLGVMVVRFSPDHFISGSDRHPLIPMDNRWVFMSYLVFKNLVGVIFILAGLVMLVLPGQGLISLIVGLSLTNFPGRRRLVRSIIRHQNVLKPANWLRRKFDRPPLKSP